MINIKTTCRFLVVVVTTTTRKRHLGDLRVLRGFMVNTHPPTHQHQERSWSKKQGVQNNILFL